MLRCGVHPRVGGETLRYSTSHLSLCGVHPRVGGETLRVVLKPPALNLGSIPAWAGKPLIERPVFEQVLRVHPRVGGETQV